MMGVVVKRNIRKSNTYVICSALLQIANVLAMTCVFSVLLL